MDSDLKSLIVLIEISHLTIFFKKYLYLRVAHLKNTMIKLWKRKFKTTLEDGELIWRTHLVTLKSKSHADGADGVEFISFNYICI